MPRPSLRSLCAAVPRATLQPPTFLRHGASGEKPALSEKPVVTFRDVELKPES